MNNQNSQSSLRHWSSAINKAVLHRSTNGSFNLCIEGGSEYGQFVVIGDVLTGLFWIKLSFTFWCFFIF